MTTMFAIVRRWRGEILYWDADIPAWHHSPSRATLYRSRTIAECLATMRCCTQVIEVYVEGEAKT